MIDIVSQLGSLVIGNYGGEILDIKDFYTLVKEEIQYAAPTVIESSALTTQNVMTSVSLAIPVYGSVTSSFSNSSVHQVKWKLEKYPHSSSFNAATTIIDMDNDDKDRLLNVLKLYPEQNIYVLRKLKIIESGTFSVTRGTQIKTSAEAAIASVITANGTYTFKAEDSEFISIPSSTYDLVYTQLWSVSDLIDFLETDDEPVSTIKEITPSILKFN